MKTKFLLILTITAFSCKSFEPDIDEFTLKRENYTGNELRTDGYYYNEFESDCQRLQIYFFYKNGIILRGGNSCKDDINIQEEKFKNGDWYNLVKDDQMTWGLFVIENDTIKYERYNPPVGPGYLHSLIWEGPILNDTTFHIIRYYRYDNGVKKEIETDKLFHFKKFSPKPDSTNNFIE